MSVFDSLFPSPPRQPDASELERTLWIRSLLGDQKELGPGEVLGQRIREAYFEKGQSLYRQGSASDRLYFIVRGSVALLHDGVKTREFGARDVLGLIDALQNRSHAFDAVVREDAVVLELDFEDWLEFLEDHFELTRSIIRQMSESLPPTSPPRPDLSKPTAMLRARRERRAATGRESYRASLGPRLSLSFVERLAVLRACPALSQSSIQALARLANFAELIYVDEGETRLLAPPALYVVESGRVRTITSNVSGSTWQEEMSAGGAVAGLGLLDEGRFDCELLALEPSALFRIPTERLFDVMEDHFSTTLSVFAHISAEAEAAALERPIGSSEAHSRPEGPHDSGPDFGLPRNSRRGG